MSLMKHVDGADVEMSAEEEAATRAEWAANSAPTIADVEKERERRLSLGFNYNFGDARGVHHIGTTAKDMKGWDEVSAASQALVAIGQPSTQIDVVTNTGSASVTALEWQMVLIAAAAARQPIWAKSFELEAMSPIPADFAADSYWS